ncbi:TWiK family of potassium channels protein 7 [Caerostris extrusa]|uniref:TWiK family of potassium channels protein 7 n=1 Tax=Caerostris extrusa TaxID=172846 RepID=A0AAV4Y8W8_CAEEX|nr:TWiK family of potassium channels protein 7 [Caerostris extrusa]
MKIKDPNLNDPVASSSFVFCSPSWTLPLGVSVRRIWSLAIRSAGTRENENDLRNERMIRSIDVNDSIAYLSSLFWYLKDKVELPEWDTRFYEELKDLDRFIVGVVKNFSYDGTMNEQEWDREWTFGNGLLYSVTILTTIGELQLHVYTDGSAKRAMRSAGLVWIWPRDTKNTSWQDSNHSLLPDWNSTDADLLANIGDLMASVFRYVYSRLCCRWCRSSRRRCEYTAEAVAQMGGRLPPLFSDNVGEEQYMPTSQVMVIFT